MRGSIQRRKRKDGSWSYQVRYDKEGSGPRRQGSKTFRRRKDAEEWLRRREDDRRDGGRGDPGATTVAELVARWIASRRTIADVTRREYARRARLHLGALGAVTLADLDPEDLEAWLSGLLAKGLAKGTVNNCWTVVHASLRAAVKWRLVRWDPSAAVEGPGVGPGRAVRLAPEERRRLWAAVEADPLRPLWRLLWLGGLRIGEAVVLRWEDVDLRAGVLRVHRTATRDGAGRTTEREGTKRGSGRLVALDAGTVAALVAWRTRLGDQRQQPALRVEDRSGYGADRHFDVVGQRQHDGADAGRDVGAVVGGAGFPRVDGVGAESVERCVVPRVETAAQVVEGHGSSYVFPGLLTAHLRPQTARERLERLCWEHRVPRLTPHMLRHLHNTGLGALKIAPRLIAQRAGQSQLATMEGYQHFSLSDQHEAAEALAADLAG